MSTKYIFFKKAFLEGASIDLYPLNYHLQMGVMLTIIKVFIILFLLYLWEQGTRRKLSKQISKRFFRMSLQVYSLLGQTEDLFLEGAGRRPHREITPQEHLVVIREEKSLSFCEIRNNPTPPLLFIRPPYKYVLQGMKFYDKFVDRYQGLSKESCCHQGEDLTNSQSFQKKMFLGI